MSSASNMRAIIIAAGMGRRLRPYTDDRPKCMLDFGGKTLLERQLEAYRTCGITDISVVRGFKKEKVDVSGVKYYENPDYENNNILNSLFYAEREIVGDVIVSYSDILFDADIPQRLMQSPRLISIAVDIDWRAYYVGRTDHPIEEAESVVFDVGKDVVTIGKFRATDRPIDGEFIGMMRLSPRGADVLKRHFARAKTMFWDKPFQRAAKFQVAYLTDMIQEMVDLGVPIHCVTIERGWKEIDTVEDYHNALKAFGS